MGSYRAYFDRRAVSPELHEKLLDMGRRPRGERPRRPAGSAWRRWAALAACCALVLGLGLSRIAAPAAIPAGAGSSAASSGDRSETPPEVSAGEGQGAADYHGFLVEGGGLEGSFDLPDIPYVNYQSVDGQLAVDGAPARYLMEGAFSVDLTRAEVQSIFWGLAGRPEGAQGDLPWMLFWGGYTLSGSALYSGAGELLWVTLQGDNTDQGISFTLTLRPGELPLQCGIYSGLETTDVFGVPVTGWSRMEDLNGDGSDDAQCVSEFMAGAVGVRFEVRCTAQEAPMDAAVLCSALLVRQALSSDGGIYLGRLLTDENIPAWREAEFSSLQEARREADFAPYLSREDPEGYGEFQGRLTYQEGNEHVLWGRWSRGYDDVWVRVSLPEGDTAWGNVVDADHPEEYDVRLYSIPWCGSVPEEYQDTVNMPVFRWEDLSQAVVEARGYEKDTGGLSFRFGVLHENGVLVEYHCDGLTAQAVWAMVRETLP